MKAVKNSVIFDSSTYFQLKEEWDEYGEFVYMGMTYKKGHNDFSARKILNRLFEPMKIQPIELSPAVISLRPFVMPVKGFGMDEVLTLIQKTVNAEVLRLKTES